MEDSPSQGHHELLAVWLACICAILLVAGKIFAIYLLVQTSILLLKVLNVIRVQAFNWCRKEAPSAEKAILITGATSGLGLATAKRLFQKGYTIIAGYYSSAEPGYAELVELGRSSSLKQQILFVNIDVRSADSIRESHLTVRKMLDAHDLRLHALINNAGVCHLHKSQWNSRENIRAVVETNLLGPMLMVREYLPTLLRSAGGRVVNVSSPACFIPISVTAHYSATKAALRHFSHSLALDLRDHPIHVVTIYPGALLGQTSIGDAQVAGSLEIRAKLNEEEKEMFGAEMEAHLKRIEYLYDVNRKNQLPEEFKMRFAVLLGGAMDPKVKLENSNVMKSFENAIMLKMPPSDMFAGNRFYSYVLGPIITSLSHTTCCWIGRAS